jgi:SNF2 family DNA or RNA helicase
MRFMTSDRGATTEDTVPVAGQIVRIRTRTYLVEDADPSHGGSGSHIRMACLDDDAQGQPLEVIWELEFDKEILDKEAWQSIGKKGFDEKRFFSAYLHTLRWNCVTATDPRLFQSPFRSGIKIDAYQLAPLRQALMLPRVNLFIADDVGLGKTIEAGLIASELLLRRRVRDIVVSCPPSMLGQWKDEMESRFGLTFEILNREYIERVRRDRGYGVNPWTTFPRFLVSHRLLIDEFYVAPLRDWLKNLRPGSLFIFDEAHHAAPSSGSKYAIDSRTTKAIRDLAPRFEHRLFLSATPHNGHSNSFSALLELLDPQRFTRGLKVLKSNLDSVMTRRLKSDIRELVGGFPKRNVIQVDLSGLPEDSAELVLPALLDEYAEIRERRVKGATKRKQAQAKLIISHLQQRLLSSVEAFAKTIAVHRRSMERVWASDLEAIERTMSLDLLSGKLDRDDDRSLLSEEEVAQIEADEVDQITRATAGDKQNAAVDDEKRLLDAMAAAADESRSLPDAKVKCVVEWIRENMCAGAKLPGESANAGDSSWQDTRLLIFTEWDDTKRYLHQHLREAIARTDDAERRIMIFHGPTPPEKRELIKRAFNMAPSDHPVRILISTDAGREGLNLQAHCHNLFHYDVPWNPSRLEQRNGRIDRKLQPAPEVFCRYFYYTQRPEDRVLKKLVEKTETIEEELGSASPVLEKRLSEMMQRGIRRDDVSALVSDIDGVSLDEEQRAVLEEELETVRLRRASLEEDLDVLRRQLNSSRRWIGLETGHFRDALDCSLELLGAEALKEETAGQKTAFRFPNLDTRRGADPTWAATLDTLRQQPVEGRHDYRWRQESPIRPVVFDAPDSINDDVVQLHLEHRVVKRLLGRFLAQGFVHHDLSRACLAQSEDAIPRVVLLGRLSLYGQGAARLHEEVLSVTARWVEPGRRQQPLAPYGRDTEARTLEILEQSLRPQSKDVVSSVVADRLQAAIPLDIEQLLPCLDERGEAAKADAEKRLAERGEAEARSMRKVLEDQKRRVEEGLSKTEDDRQLLLSFAKDEKKQRDSDRRYWSQLLENIDSEIAGEPKRIRDFYGVRSYRIEPVGLAYLWPVSG